MDRFEAEFAVIEKWRTSLGADGDENGVWGGLVTVVRQLLIPCRNVCRAFRCHVLLWLPGGEGSIGSGGVVVLWRTVQR